MSRDKILEKFLSKESKQGTLYSDLALLYDYIYSEHYDYDIQASVVSENSPNTVNSILEGACGTGRLTHRLAEKYPNITGFDLNMGMLSIARERYPSLNFKNDDLTQLSSITNTYDLYCVLGNSAVYLGQDFEQFGSQAFNVLNRSGKLIFDYMSSNQMKNAYYGENIFSSDNYKVNRKVITTTQDSQTHYFSFLFTIKDRETGEEITTVGDTHQIRTYTRDDIKETLYEIGFTNVEIKDYSDTTNAAVENQVVVAQK